MMKKTLLSFGLYSFVMSSAFAEDTNSPLQGAWEWVTIKNSCVEIYTFGIENTAYIISGEEKSDARYTISENLLKKGFIKSAWKFWMTKAARIAARATKTTQVRFITNL